MRRNKHIFLTILITLALVCLAWSAGIGQQTTPTVACVVAGEAIAAGSQVRADQLKIVQVPETAAAECYRMDAASAAGRWTVRDIAEGTLISGADLRESAAGICYPDAGTGRRLLTIKLDPADANGFWLAAGNRVDLYLVPQSRENGLEMQVMAGIRVMAVLGGDNTRKSIAQPTADTLLCLDLSVDQAWLLYNAYGLYTLHVAVVNETLATG